MAIEIENILAGHALEGRLFRIDRGDAARLERVDELAQQHPVAQRDGEFRAFRPQRVIIGVRGGCMCSGVMSIGPQCPVDYHV